jgi:hypothetical protein
VDARQLVEVELGDRDHRWPGNWSTTGFTIQCQLEPMSRTSTLFGKA